MDKLCKELNILAKAALKMGYEAFVQKIYTHQSAPMYGLNKFVNPKNNEKYSQNIYRWLTYSKHKQFTNIFKDSDGIYYIGLRDDAGIWCGAKLVRVVCLGCKAETFSYPTSITREWNDVTVKFWTRYLSKGKEGFKKIWF